MEVRVDEENDIPYVHMEDTLAAEISFVRSRCPSKEVMYVQCSDLSIIFKKKFKLKVLLKK